MTPGMTPLQQMQLLLQQANAAADAAEAALQQMQQQSGGSGSPNFFPTTFCLPFTYQVTIGTTQSPILPNAQQGGKIQFAADSTFELLRILGNSSADVPTNYFQNNFQVQLQDGASGRYMSDQPIPQMCMVTDAYQYGNDEKYPIRFPANSILSVNVTNLLNANLIVSIFLKGYKFFQIAAPSDGGS